MYTEEEIKLFSSILRSYEKSQIKKKKKKRNIPIYERCKHKNKEIIDYAEVCCDCGLEIQRILKHEVGVFDWERCCYRKKSVYQRKYFFKKKINEIQKNFDLKSEDISKIYEILYKIVMSRGLVIHKQVKINDKTEQRHYIIYSDIMLISFGELFLTLTL